MQRIKVVCHRCTNKPYTQKWEKSIYSVFHFFCFGCPGSTTLYRDCRTIVARSVRRNGRMRSMEIRRDEVEKTTKKWANFAGFGTMRYARWAPLR